MGKRLYLLPRIVMAAKGFLCIELKHLSTINYAMRPTNPCRS